jgi:hypothetical protein
MRAISAKPEKKAAEGRVPIPLGWHPMERALDATAEEDGRERASLYTQRWPSGKENCESNFAVDQRADDDEHH